MSDVCVNCGRCLGGDGCASESGCYVCELCPSCTPAAGNCRDCRDVRRENEADRMLRLSKEARDW